jgi:hypothetical protein
MFGRCQRAGFPSPVRGEAHSMPTHYSLGPDDGYGVKNARTATIEPNENVLQDVDKPGCDRPVDEIDITPAMIEAGEAVLDSAGSG